MAGVPHLSLLVVRRGAVCMKKKNKIEKKIVGFKQMKETRGKGIEASECGSCDLL